MNEVNKWYQKKHLMDIIGSYLKAKELVSLMTTNKAFNLAFNSNKIWWIIYNQKLSKIRIIDADIFENYIPMKAFTAKKACKAACEALKSRTDDFAGIKAKPENNYTISVTGTLGELPKTKSLITNFEPSYDLFASFSSPFLFQEEICHLCVIGLPKTSLELSGKYFKCVVFLISDTKSEENNRLIFDGLKLAKTFSMKIFFIINKLKNPITNEQKNGILSANEEYIEIDIFSEINLAHIAFKIITRCRENMKNYNPFILVQLS